MQEKVFHDQTNAGYRQQPGTKGKPLPGIPISGAQRPINMKTECGERLLAALPPLQQERLAWN
ncbi:hypothetical protein EYF80_021558 [Liparis tanakae]|uniref:Uncharacterized protein n=1 Tax=Liparis tanakae TaxID=230148 RepID=A0A4Z2HQW5_9TELE|nr:hypothetical protein EYF80_021558 [Liparis tanakae]